jgi:hypothetical protein
MDTNDIAVEYRLSHWAGIMREREESGLSIRAYCKNAGFHENRYFYWQKKLREAACEELAKVQGNTTGMTPMGFTEIKMPAQMTLPMPVSSITLQGQICIEATGMRITADSAYPIAHLTEFLRGVALIC